MRNNILRIVSGTNQTGKTTYILNFADKYSRKTGKRVLFINITAEKKITDFCKKNPRKFMEVIPEIPFGMKKNKIYSAILERIYTDVSDTLIVIDDARDFISNCGDSIYTVFGTHRRQRNNDVILCFHAPGEIPPGICQYVTDYVIKFSRQNPDMFRKLPPEVIEIQKQVNAAGLKNRFHTRYYNAGTGESAVIQI